MLQEIFENKVKEQKGAFLGILAVTLRANLSGTMLAGKGIGRGDNGII